MILSQTTTCVQGTDDFNSIELLARAGFDAADYCMIAMHDADHPLNGGEYKAYAAKLLETAKKNKIFFNQGHGVCGVPAADLDEKIKRTVGRNIRAIEVCALLGIGTLVVHPFTPPDYVGNEEAAFERNIRYFRALLPAAEACGVKLACENMWCGDRRRGGTRAGVCGNPYEHARYVDAMASEWFAACLDVGHCSLDGREAQDCIRVLGSRVQALHIHDNDYRDDMHTLPGLSEMNWDAITKALAETHYSGDFTLETDHFFDSLRGEDEILPGLVLAERIGRKMIRKIEDAAAAL